MTGLEPLLIAAVAAAPSAATLGTAATVASVAGAGISAIGSIQQGKAASRAANYQADQMDAAAKQIEAKAQRDALEQKRQMNLVRSRAMTIGASDGSLASPTVANILGGLDMEADTAYNNTIIQGQEQAQGLRTNGGVQRIEGQNAKRAAKIQAMSQAISGIAGTSSLASKYGAGITTKPDIIGSAGSSTLRG